MLRYRALFWVVALAVFAVDACGAVPVITSPTSASGTLDSAFSYQITANNTPESYNATGLPSGLSVNPSTGLISGKPTQTGSFSSTIEASSASGTGSATLIINVQTVVSWPSVGSVPSTLNGVSAIAGGGGHCLALKSDGTVVAWGSNGSGQANVLTGLNTAVAIACGDSHSMALRADGTVVGWGTPYQANLPGNLTNVVAIAAGYFHNLALKSDGTVVAWGLSYYNATAVPAGLNNVVAVAAGYYHSLALRADGTVVGWGATFAGQATIPSGLNNVIAIAAGENHSLALKSDGTVVAWGQDWNGRTAVPAGLKDVVAIACGGGHSLALKSDGKVVAWGYNGSGQTNVPANLSNVVAIGNTRGDFSLALTGNDSAASRPVIISCLRVLGASYPFHYRIVAKNSPTSYGATGLPDGVAINTSTGVISGTPSQSGTFNITLSATNTNGTSSATLALTVLPSQVPVIASSLIANATVGFPFSYQIGATNLPTSYGVSGLPPGLSINTATGLISGTPTQPGPSNVTITATNASGTGSATLVLFPQTVIGWGSNSANETTIPAGLNEVVAIDADSYSSLALKANGTVVAWGDNDFNKGVVPTGLNSVVAISNGGGHSLALKSDGTVVAWGSNVWGQSTIPAGLKDVVAISAGWLHNLALKSDGRVVAWGHNGSGEGAVPAGLKDVVAIAAGKEHSVVLRADGTVVSWGYLTATGNGIVPAGLNNVVAIASGENHILALKSDGTVVAWGSNWAGQTSVPSGLNDVVAIAAGVVHSMALKADGTVVAWGAVNAGYQGVGQATVSPALANVVAIAAGDVHSLALIGNESTTAKPVIISPLKTVGALFPFRYRIVAKNAPSRYDATGLPRGLSVDTTAGVISGTPTQTGTFNTVISATNVNGTTSANLTISVLSPSPVDGTLTMKPGSPVLSGAAVVATTSGWRDPDGPLTYQFLLDDAVLGPPSGATTVNFTAPAAGGTHVLKVRVTDALGNFTDSALDFIVNTRPVALAAIMRPTSGPGGFTTIDVAPLISDPDGDELTIASATPGAHAPVSFNGRVLTFGPADTSFTGNDSFTYTISDGRGGRATATITLKNAMPVAVADAVATKGEPVTFDPRLNDTDADNDSLLVLAVTQGASGTVVNDGASITYTPGPRFFGRDTFTYTVSDGVVSAAAIVTVRSPEPIALVGPTTGEQVLGQSEGIVYESFGAPACEVFSGKIRGPKGPAKRAVFSKDGTVLLAVGSAAPGPAGTTISALDEPNGAAVIATLRGSGISAANKRALIVGLNDGNLRVGIHEGDPLPGALKVKRFLSIDGNGDTVFLLVKLAGAGVTSATDVALLAIGPDDAVKMLARKGDVIGGRRITVLASLVSVAGTAAEERWRSGDDAIGVRLTFSGKEQALYTIPATANGPEEWIAWIETGDLLTGAAQARSFGLPGFGTDGVAFTARLEPTSDRQVSALNDTTVFRATSSGLSQLAREGDLIAGIDGSEVPGVRFKKFGDPVAGPDGRTAFAAALAGKAVASSNNMGLWLAESGGNLRQIARTGDPAPGGGKWGTFESLAFPDAPQSGPIFTAKLLRGAHEDVTRKTGRGMWGVNSAGMLQLLLRTGDTLSVNAHARVVKSFVALTGVQGSLGSARGYDNDRHVTVIATFTDGEQAIVNITVP